MKQKIEKGTLVKIIWKPYNKRDIEKYYLKEAIVHGKDEEGYIGIKLCDGSIQHTIYFEAKDLEILYNPKSINIFEEYLDGKI